MKKSNLRLMVAALFAALTFITSCSQQEDADLAAPDANAINPEVVEQLRSLDFDVSDIIKDGENYIVERDITITPAALQEMLNGGVEKNWVGPNGEQYRTNNLVTGLPRTIRVWEYPNLPSRTKTGLTWALANYNRLNIGLNFVKVTGNSPGAWDIVVYATSSSSGGGSAGFPSGGDPYPYVNILSGTANFSTNVNEHVVCHEIGHCLGFRHTDWFNRSYSCGSGGSEGTAGVGAIHIPGTPTNEDPGSIMLACFNSGVNGEFNANDITALEFLY